MSDVLSIYRATYWDKSVWFPFYENTLAFIKATGGRGSWIRFIITCFHAVCLYNTGERSELEKKDNDKVKTT